MNYLTQVLRSAPALIVLSMIFIFIELNTPAAFTFSFGRVFNPKEPLTLSFMVVYIWAFLLLLPLLINRFFLKEPLKNFGLQLPVGKKKTLFFILLALLLLTPVSFFLAHQRSIQIFYTLKGFSLAHLAFIVFIIMPPYYLAEEFFFRGFLFLRLQRQLGWHSYWITELIFTWAHLGKPPIEILVSFPAGLVLNYLAFHTKSIYPAMLVHFMMGGLMLVLVMLFV